MSQSDFHRATSNPTATPGIAYRTALIAAMSSIPKMIPDVEAPSKPIAKIIGGQKYKRTGEPESGRIAPHAASRLGTKNPNPANAATIRNVVLRTCLS